MRSSFNLHACSSRKSYKMDNTKSKWLVTIWEDNSTEIQPSNKVVCDKIEKGSKVLMEWKNVMWNETIDSVWGIVN